MNRRIRLKLWPLLASMLAGCGGMMTSDEPAEHVYWLDATTLSFGESSTQPKPELVIVVNSLPGLDTDRILVKGPGARINHYAGARWPDHLPEVISATVRLSFESSGQFSRVDSRSPGGDKVWSLELELREYFAVATTTDGAPQVHVQLAGHVNCDSAEGTVDASAIAAASENRLTAIVAAFQAATNEALTKLGQQLENTCF
jgi:ABC-type uncharacterized transport system auxiliary subunit